MEGKFIFSGPLNQTPRLGSDVDFWTKVFQQLAEAEEVFSKNLQVVVNTINDRLGQRDIASLKGSNTDFNNCVLQVETFKDHVIAEKRKAVRTLETSRNAALELRRSSTDKLVETTNRIDACTLKNMKKAFLKKEKSVTETRTAYHEAMTEVEHTQIQMLRLGYDKGTLDNKLHKLERQARDARALYKHTIRQAENQLELLKAASKQCEVDWVEMETAKFTLIARVTEDYLRHVCPTCSLNGEKFGGPGNIENMIRSTANHETVPSLEFEDYQMPILRLVMSKLKHEITSNTETRIGGFEYDEKKVNHSNVIKPCSDKRRHFLSLKKGLKVTQLIKPTSEGWAFGETRKMNGKSLKFGFYHVDCVKKV